MKRKAVRRKLAEEMTVNTTPDKIFPQLCPVRELDWLDQWECEIVWTNSGYAEDDCIFRTWFPDTGGRETWVVSRYEPDETIEFVRINTSRVMRYRITLHPEGGKTRLRWHQLHTSLDEVGRRLVENLDERAYTLQIKWLEKSLNHYFETGERLPVSERG